MKSNNCCNPSHETNAYPVAMIKPGTLIGHPLSLNNVSMNQNSLERPLMS